LFKLVEPFDGEIDCGETEPLDEGGDASMEITRGFDTDGGCKGPNQKLLFNFETGEDEIGLFVDFIAEPVDGDSVAQFIEVITWIFDAPPEVPEGESQLGSLSYDDHVGAGRRVMQWCLADPRDEEGNLPGGAVNINLYLPSGHTSCLIETSGHVTMLGDFIKTDVVYNIADGKRWSR
jgi:hypothetical protein